MSRILINDLEEFDTLANRGEKDFRNYVEDQYQNSKCDVRLYFEPVGNKKFPDYVMFHQKYGYFFFEVKGIKIDQVIQVGPKNMEYFYTEGGQKKNEKVNYFNRLRDLTLGGEKAIEEKRWQLGFLFGKNKEVPKRFMPHNFAIVFTSISREEAIKSGKFQYDFNQFSIKSSNIIFKDDLTPSECDILKELSYVNETASPIPEDVYKECVVTVHPDAMRDGFIVSRSEDKEFKINIDLNSQNIKDNKKYIHILDGNQTNCARLVTRGGYRFVRGIAGSGKTLVLLFAIKRLIEKKDVKLKILVLFYTGTLKSYYSSFMKTFSSNPNVTVEVETFWNFAQKKLGIRLSDYDLSSDSDNQRLGLDAERYLLNNPSINYDFVLIDEAQDFPMTWGSVIFRLAKGVDEQSKNVVAVFDHKQDIYGSSSKSVYDNLTMSRKIKVTGARVQYLRTCYRSSEAIFSLANIFSKEIQEDKIDSIDFRLPNLEKPLLKYLANEQEQMIYLTSLKDAVRSGRIHGSDVCVVYPSRYITHDYAIELASKLGMDSFQVYLTNKKRYPNNQFRFGSNKVTFMSTNLVKGLEFGYVVMFGFDLIPIGASKIENIFYTAITRAQSKLDILYSKESEPIVKIREHLNSYTL